MQVFTEKNLFIIESVQFKPVVQGSAIIPKDIPYPEGKWYQMETEMQKRNRGNEKGEIDKS